MTHPEHDERLADYLGGEMDPAERSRFEADLARDPRLAAEAAALRGTVETMRGLRGVEPWSSDEPAAVTSGAGRRRSPWGAVLRYAAVIALAFLIGYVVRGASTGGAVLPVPQPLPIVEAPPPEGLQQRFAEAYQRNAGRSSMGRMLIAIAQTSGE